jgi:hypothetical protein
MSAKSVSTLPAIGSAASSGCSGRSESLEGLALRPLLRNDRENVGYVGVADLESDREVRAVIFDSANTNVFLGPYDCPVPLKPQTIPDRPGCRPGSISRRVSLAALLSLDRVARGVAAMGGVRCLNDEGTGFGA